MAKYTLIASRDAFESKESERFCALAGDLKRAGNEVTLFLVQNGVLCARPSNVASALSKLAQEGVAVLADSFSLRERGIASDRLAAGIQSAQLDVIVDHMAEGRKVIWN
jgi:sulfur relay (sulfurtransferase) complex TusBCD TusD component (DsrE family)